jgi:hypothetical protein
MPAQSLFPAQYSPFSRPQAPAPKIKPKLFAGCPIISVVRPPFPNFSSSLKLPSKRWQKPDFNATLCSPYRLFAITFI